MPTRTARTVWNGSPEDGTGTVTLVSSGVGTYEVNFPKRAADNADGTTSPEELIAAAHAGCFTMALAFALQSAGFKPTELTTEAAVSLEPDGPQGFKISRSALTLRAQVSGISPEKFASIAQDAERNCPVSKVLKAEITLDAKLA